MAAQAPSRATCSRRSTRGCRFWKRWASVISRSTGRRRPCRAAQLGSNLQGVCYILDEPTIGLHSRDNRILLDTLGRLAAKGNSLLVVEHDEETIRRADHVIDLGPGAGTRGGHVVAAGTAQQLEL